MKIVDISKSKEPVGLHVKEQLESALKLAESNSISNVAIVMVNEDGDVMDCWANGNNPFAIVGGLESLKFEFMRAQIESRED